MVPHTDETRAAVLAALMAGQSISAVADHYHLSRSTVRSWRAASGMIEHPPVIDQESQADIGGLVTSYLETALETLRAQATFFRDPTWLGKQPAADLAVLHGVIADKAFRIVSAFEDAATDPPTGPG